MRARSSLLCALALLASCGKSHEPTLDERIKAVKVVGTVVDETLRTAGTHDLLVVPMDEHGLPLLDPGFVANVAISAPPGLTARVVDKQCVALHDRQPLAMVVAVDDSSSMRVNDPDSASGIAPGRRRVAQQAVDRLEPGDIGALGDFFGRDQTVVSPLRDLVCHASDPTAACVAGESSFTSDTASLDAAIGGIASMAGSPLYAACAQAVTMLATRPEARRALVILSDGAALSDVATPGQRASCLDSARSNNITIYTIGFGSGAEGAPVAPTSAGSCPAGWYVSGSTCVYTATDVQNLRELAEASGGTYAPAPDTARVGALLQEMAFSQGYCTVRIALDGIDQVPERTKIIGRITVGVAGAVTTYDFLAPRTQ